MRKLTKIDIGLIRLVLWNNNCNKRFNLNLCYPDEYLSGLFRCRLKEIQRIREAMDYENNRAYEAECGRKFNVVMPVNHKLFHKGGEDIEEA
jgi:hypothetical protein